MMNRYWYFVHLGIVLGLLLVPHQDAEIGSSLRTRPLEAPARPPGACERGRLAALEDLRQDSLGWYCYGHLTPRLTTWMRVLTSSTEIEIRGGGCLIDPFGTCYNEIMRPAILAKYGDHFFADINRKVDSLYT
ncbi:MAG: hypothetical protein KDC54_19565, partial [Lewinella sp.]|nr:hypothetical protein [Lewinella sp.]